MLELRAGDVLYLPRGTPHAARAASDTPSLHLTLTVASADFAWGKLIEGALRELYLRDEAQLGLGRDLGSVHEKITSVMRTAPLDPQPHPPPGPGSANLSRWEAFREG